ncbi:MAG: hypothetical protein AB7E42_08540 [Anaerotignaceae bacterium]
MNNAINEIHALAPPGITGEGIGIAILDTGICPLEDFTFPQNRIIAFKDFVYGQNVVYDDNGHGTHVTGYKSKRYTFQYIVTSLISSRLSISIWSTK